MADLEDWRSITNRFREGIDLGTYPIGIRLFERASEILQFSSARVLRSTAPCQMTAYARYYRQDGIVTASAQSMKCLWGLACLGLIRSPKRLTDGDLNLAFTKDKEAASALQAKVHMLGDEGKRFESVLMAPLDLMPAEPDAIVVYLTPGQALKVLLGRSYAEGKVLEDQTITGQSSVCSAISRIIDGEDMVMEIPCVGDRMWGLVRDEEMVIVFSPQEFRRVLNGMEETDAFARHPFRPFLHWPVVFPPSFEPRPNELD